MKPAALAFFATTLLAMPAPARAHPAPFSYVDMRIGPGGIDLSLVAHILDVSHDLHVEPQERLLEPAFLSQQNETIIRLLSARIRLLADGVTLVPDSWSSAQALPLRQAIEMRARFAFPKEPGVLTLHATMFPYDPAHQTFVNVYEDDQLTHQAILDAGKPRLDYYPGSRQGALAVVKRFAPVGARHVLFGLDHLAFLVALLLLGGSVRQLWRLVLAFVAANAVALLLTALNVLNPPARIIEPAVALGIVYVGADNLLVHGGRDMRGWIAFAFGLIHGFWFANGLRASDLPVWTLGWSLFAFDMGLELAQVLVILVVGSAVIAFRARNPIVGRRLVTVGSTVAIVAGTYWFVQRVFFPAGLI